MSNRHQPTPAQQASIDHLSGVGYTTLRTRSYTRLLERVRLAEAREAMAREQAAASERWAIRESDEMRRLSERLTRVAAAAAALGVPMAAINALLDGLTVDQVQQHLDRKANR